MEATNETFSNELKRKWMRVLVLQQWLGKKPNPNKSEGYFLIGDAAISLS